MTSDAHPTDRFGVISDIHGNLEALQAVLATLEIAGVRDIVCCGDVVGYGASPNECVALLRTREIPTVLGNHDVAVLGSEEIESFNEMARDAVLWTRDVLTPENLAWLAALPMTIERHGAFFVHASPCSPSEWNYVLTYVDAREAFNWFAQPLCFLGHSHQPFFIALANGELYHIRQEEAPLDPLTRMLVNVGSVGQPRDRDPRAACVVVDPEARLIQLLRVDYDIAAAQARIHRVGRHRGLAERLAHGC